MQSNLQRNQNTCYNSYGVRPDADWLQAADRVGGSNFLSSVEPRHHYRSLLFWMRRYHLKPQNFACTKHLPCGGLCRKSLAKWFFRNCDQAGENREWAVTRSSKRVLTMLLVALNTNATEVGIAIPAELITFGRVNIESEADVIRLYGCLKPEPRVRAVWEGPAL